MLRKWPRAVRRGLLVVRKSWRQWSHRGALGALGERLAATYLKGKGYVIVGRGSRSRLGEIDLIAVDEKTIVFVEVKTRRSASLGHPDDAIHPEKQRRLTRLALRYLMRHDLLDHPARFDAVSIVWPDDSKTPQITHYENAFAPSGLVGMWS